MDQLRSIYGDKFLKFVLASDSLPEPASASEWTEQQVSVIGDLTILASRVQDMDEAERANIISRYVVAVEDDSKTSIANTWRQQCGGEVFSSETTTEEDECLFWLSKAACDIFPAFLLSEPVAAIRDPMGLVGTHISAMQHPSLAMFCNAILRDEKAKRLFPDAPEQVTSEGISNELIDINSNLVLSTGRGGSLQLVGLLNMILQISYCRLLLTDDHSVNGYMSMTAKTLDQIRSLAKGRSVTLPVIVGLRGILIPSGTTITLPWGLIRNPQPDDARFLPRKEDTTAVLVTSTSMKVLSKKPIGKPNDDDFINEFQRHAQTFENNGKDLARTINLTQYAFLLATKKPPYTTPVSWTTCVIDPLQHAPWSSFPIETAKAVESTTLTADFVKEVETWGTKLASHPRKLDVAVRRTLSAVGGRTDPLDGFIDAVLAWENMFSDSPETTLKVCGAIAILLERYSFENRNALFKELQTIYRQRSVIVHGSATEPSQHEAFELRNRAIEIAILSMRALYEEADQDLLLEDSAARGKRILLGVLDG